MRRTLILGGPGAGKTERLMRVMEDAIGHGVPPAQIAFYTFTTAAAEVARDRACERFGLTPKELPHFRTIHSEAFRQLGLKRAEVLSDAHLVEVAALTGELLSSAFSIDDGPAAGMSADPLLTIDHYARTTRKTLRAAWQEHGGELDWFRLKRFVDAYTTFKQDRGLLDFTDMLERYDAAPASPLAVRVGIVDEGQDLTILQWRVVTKLLSHAEELYAAGDDLQSVHRWAGAAEDYFIGLDWPREVIPLSRRIPRTIHALASEVAARVGRKHEREWLPAPRPGSVAWVGAPEDVDLGSGSWLLLARTRAQLVPLAEAARSQGVVFSVKGRSSVSRQHVRAIQAHEALRAGKKVAIEEIREAAKAAGRERPTKSDGAYTAEEAGYDASVIWHDALLTIPVETREYYVSCLRRGESLTKEPRVRVETIHGAKGAEASHVALSTDLTPRTNRGFELDPDSEHRVFFVGLTRASETLTLIAPQTAYGYPL